MSAEIDLRIKQLSYSSMLTLHSCPRKMQLYKLQAAKDDVDYESSVTFAYGHVVGAGIQDILAGKSEAEVMLNAFLLWEPDLFAENKKQNKSFWTAIAAIQKFNFIHTTGYLKDYELVYHNGEPAVELSFIISMPDGFMYRGFVDAVLRHKQSGKILVLECKTTSANYIHAAMYKNSAQAIGYSIVLDVLFPALSSYEVLYLIYKSKGMEYEQMPFNKSYYQRALWIQELLLDVETIKMYEAAGIYPMRGESCFSYYRECEYFNACTLSTNLLTSPLTDEEEAKILSDNDERYKIKVSIQDLIAAQLEKE